MKNLILAAALSLAATNAAAEPVRVKVETGVLVGDARDGVASFQAVPYAAPPVGDLRWAPPARPVRWTGERDATQQGPACMQKLLPGGLANGGGVKAPVSEDCLQAYVWAPVDAKAAPVLVWIHGGSHKTGAGYVTSGAAFARDGVVVVSINYRLGPFGSFAHPALTKAARGGPVGNYGLMDQVAALDWVKRNISAFGGDPRQVTVAGESAGAMCVQFLMATPAARGLYRRAIVQSGGGWYPKETLADREATAVAAEPALGLTAPTLADLRALPAQTVLDKVGGAYAPFVDGVFLKETPTEAFLRRHVPDVPLMIGTNSGEDILMGPYVPAMSAAVPAKVRAAYPDEAARGEEALVRADYTDRVFAAPARWVARQASEGAPAWLYHFSYVTSRYRPITKTAYHAAEIEFVFKDFGATPDRFISPDDRAMAELMHACWLAFVKGGPPTCGGAGPWPAYQASSDTLYQFGSDSGPRTAFRKAQLDAQTAATSLVPAR